MTDSNPVLYRGNKFEALNDEGDEVDTLNVDKNSKTNNTVLKNIEENMFKQYYSKKTTYKQNKSGFNNNYNNNYNSNNNYNNYNNQNNDGYTTINSYKKEKVVQDCTEIDVDENLYDLELPNSYRVLAHHNDDKNWDYLSYHNITILNKWRDVSQFFNTLNKSSGECKYTDFDIFIMKGEISPMWEDLENRKGSICSIKIDSIATGYELLKNLSYHMVNNTLLKFTPNLWNVVNGLSFSPKKIDNNNLDSYCVIIKIWFKVNIIKFGNIDKLFNNDIAESINRYSIKVKSINPEY
jgi:hypothetical protein